MHMEECGDNVCVSCGLQNEPAGEGCICPVQDSTEVCGNFSETEKATVKVVAASSAKCRWASSNGTLSNDKLKDQPNVNLTDTDSESKCTTQKSENSGLQLLMLVMLPVLIVPIY